MVLRIPVVVSDDCELEELQPGDSISGGALPAATQVGQVLFSIDGSSFTVELPVTNPFGWIVNDEGILIVNG